MGQASFLLTMQHGRARADRKEKRPRRDSNPQPTDIVLLVGIRRRRNDKRPRRDSNPQPTDSKSGALSIELRRRVSIILQAHLSIRGLENAFLKIWKKPLQDPPYMVYSPQFAPSYSDMMTRIKHKNLSYRFTPPPAVLPSTSPFLRGFYFVCRLREDRYPG